MCGITKLHNSKALIRRPLFEIRPSEPSSLFNKFQQTKYKKPGWGNSRFGRLKLCLFVLIPWLLGLVTFSGVGGLSAPIISEVHNKVPTGAVINLFPRYGYLSLSMRVVARNDSQSWVFLEPIKDFFLGSTIHVEERSFTTTPPDDSLPIHNEFHIDLCEDTSQLVQAYFRRFYIEGLDKPWQAFAGGWRTPSLSKYFGIDPNYVVGDYRYMLVRVLMVRDSGKATPLYNISAAPAFAPDMGRVFPENDLGMYHFLNKVGTHYVHGYVAGNAIYQVYVYDASGFNAVKRRLSEYNGMGTMSVSQLPNLLSLWVRQIGKLFMLNSSPKVSDTITELLNTDHYKTSIRVPNIFKLHDNPELVSQVEQMLKQEPSGLLGIDLRMIDSVFHNVSQRKWFIESLQHKMQLWEINFQ